MYPRNYQDAVQKLRQAVIATMTVRQPPRTAQKGVLDTHLILLTINILFMEVRIVISLLETSMLLNHL